MNNALKHAPILAGLSVFLLTACGSYTAPASVRTSTGEVLVGSTTASLSGGTFEVSGANGLSCRGNYDAMDTSPTISAPLICSDGRSGTVTVTRTRDGLSGSGTAQLNDGSTAEVGFGKLAATVTSPQSTSSPAVVAAVAASPTYRAVRTTNRTCYTGPRGGTYTITASGNKNYNGC